MSVRQKQHSSRTTTASAPLRPALLGILLVWSAPAQLAALGLQTGGAVSAMTTADRLALALGIAALLLVAVGVGYFLQRRRQDQGDMPIPLIIDLDALAAAAGAANANQTSQPWHPAEGSPPARSRPPAEHADPSLASPLQAPLLVRNHSPPAAQSTAPATPPAWLGAATAASHTSSTSNGAAGRVVREESVASTPKGPAREVGGASLVHPPAESPVSPRVPTSYPADGSAQPSMHLPTVVLDVSTELPLQLLPGSLEVLEGPGKLTPIRFFRTAALEIPEVTLGRAHGPAYRHINLWAPSVSRMHARMRFEGGRWKIFNLSQTNPLRVNDLGLDAPEVGCLLDDGDRIQLGEVVLRYREQPA